MDRRAYVSSIRAAAQRLVNILAQANVRRTEADQVGAALCCTAAELLDAILLVAASRAPHQALALIRSLQEAEVDARALVNDRSVLDSLKLKSARQLVQTYEAFATDEDQPVFSGALAEPLLQSNVQFARDEAHRLTALGVKALTVEGRFKRAGLTDQYRSSYAMLCSGTHNDLNSLAARHIREGRLVIFDAGSDDELHEMLGIALATFVGAVRTMPSFSDLTPNEVETAIADTDVDWMKLSTAFLSPQDEPAFGPSA